MVYPGSKNKLAKSIVPILQGEIDSRGITTYVEPMGGGGNLIDKVRCKRRIYNDSHPYLVALLEHVEETGGKDLPETVTKEHHTYVRRHPEEFEPWYVGLIGFVSYGGKWNDLYPNPSAKLASRNRSGKDDKAGQMIKNIKKQAPRLKGVEFRCGDYRELDIPDGSLVYADPPYKNTAGYKGTESFDHETYYSWLRELAKRCAVYCSELWMPDDFEVVWSTEFRVSMASNDNQQKRIENLYRPRV